MKRRTLAIVLALCAPLAARAESAALLGRSYPIEFSVSYPAALFHWVDSLAGTSGGKTIRAYQREYFNYFGEPRGLDSEILLAFRQARSPLWLGMFCRAESMPDALATVEERLGVGHERVVRRALDRFRGRYDAIWRDGEVPRAFLADVRRDPARKKLGRLLSDIAGFFGVDPSAAPEPPRVVLVPVPAGFGTHAEAIGNMLLIEIPPGDRLADQASVIVHENAHYLFGLIEEEREKRLAAAMAAAGPRGEEAWKRLHEALPTALGQGIADRMFYSKTWSQDFPWYHALDVDAYAKAIYPLVDRALRSNGKFDEEFLLKALERFPE